MGLNIININKMSEITSSGGHLSARNDTSISYMASNDIVLQIKDDIQIKISELHNESPEPNGYELEKFIIKYCREYYGI
jgi:hypothetical protein